jgi:molecular chaperone GrpE
VKKNPTTDPVKHQEAAASKEGASDQAVSQTPQAEPAASAPELNLQAEVERYRDQALRAAADLENYRKRMVREKEDAIRFANAGLLEKILPILDNFELGLEAARGDASAQGSKGIVDGFAMVHRQLGDFLVSSGLQPIDAVGQPFDPKFHEALGHETDASYAEGVVLRQLRRGYRLADRLVRPSSVIVNKLA